MGWRVRRSVRLGKGYRINISKSGISTSSKIGPVTVNSRRGTTIRVAKGLSYHVDRGSRRSAIPSDAVASTARGHGCVWTAVKWAVIAVVVLVVVGLIFG